MQHASHTCRCTARRRGIRFITGDGSGHCVHLSAVFSVSMEWPGQPGPGADVAGVSPIPLQMRAGLSPISVQM